MVRHAILVVRRAVFASRRGKPARTCRPLVLALDVVVLFRGRRLDDIRRYCETDVMNTYLLYCRFQKMRGGLTEKEHDQEIELVKTTLGNLAPSESHWQEYLAAWK